jgi:hypothetical protein
MYATRERSAVQKKHVLKQVMMEPACGEKKIKTCKHSATNRPVCIANPVRANCCCRELKYTFAEPVGAVRIVEDWSGEGNGIAGLQWLGGVMLWLANV